MQSHSLFQQYLGVSIFALYSLSALISTLHAQDDIELFEEDVPIVLSASRLIQPIASAPASITVIDAEMIRLSGARAIVDILRLVPGFDMVLLDLHMPVQDGFKVAEMIRPGDSINSQVPIIAMTADAYQATRERALSAGFDDVLTKPATVQQVSETIGSWVNQGRRSNPLASPP